MTAPLPSIQPAANVSQARTGGHRLDRPAAKARYVALDPNERTFQRISEEFRTSRTTIRKWARIDGWEQAAAKADRNATAKAVAQAERTREQRAVQVARIRDYAADHLERKLVAANGSVDLDDPVVVAVWKEADRQYRLDIGEVTDRIEVREVREVLLATATGYDELLVRVLAAELGNGKARVILGAFRAAAPRVLELAASSVGEAS